MSDTKNIIPEPSLAMQQLYFQTRTILIRNDIEPSERNMAKAFGLSQTTFRRKIMTKFIKISEPNSILAKHAPLGVGSSMLRIQDGSVCGAHVNQTNLVDYLCVMELPFTGILTGSNHTLSGSDVHDALSVSLYHSLRKNKYFHSSLSFKNGFSYADRVNSLFKTMSLSGYRVHHDNPNLKYLLKNDRTYQFTSLFERKGSYVVGLKSSKTWFTEYSEDVIIPDAMEFFFGLQFAECHIAPTDLIITRSQLGSINIKRDLYILMSKLKGMNDGSYVLNRDINDIQFSRVYSLATSLSSNTRTQLGYHNYDMDAALQSITFNFLNIESYPLHKRLVLDKKKFRETIQLELDTSYDRVKTLLSAADNGQKNNARNISDTLAEYAAESERMVDEFLAQFKTINPKMYARAIKLAKYNFQRIWNRETKENEYIKLDKNKYSIFFFCWTQIEREIRQVMISCFRDKVAVLEVHDAVYSKEYISTSILEERIQNQLGLTIGISN